MKNKHDPKKPHQLKVLVVEDSADTMDLICLALKKLGAEIVTANNGKDGIEKALSAHPDIVLLDLEMPEVSGFGVIKHLRTKHFDRPVLAITSHDTVHDRDRCFEAGFKGYVTKPFDTKRLAEIVNLHLPEHLKSLSKTLNDSTHPAVHARL